MQPLYFLPRAADNRRETIIAHGLGYIFADIRDDEVCGCQIIGKGPSGEPGWIVAAKTVPSVDADGITVPARPPVEMRYKPDSQTWKKTLAGDIWIGVNPADPPTPVELQRRQTFPGTGIDLAGDSWNVPLLRRPDDSSLLPRSFEFDSAGRLHQPLDERYREIWERTAEAVELFVGGGDTDEAISWALPLCVDALALNYRFGRDEQNVLKLLDSRNWLAVLAAAIGYYDPAVQDDIVAKKNARQNTEPEPVSSPAGQPEDCQTTDPLESTCTV